MVNTVPSQTVLSLPLYESNNGQSPPSVDRDSAHDVPSFQTIAARIRQLRDIISEMDEDRSFFLHALDRSLQEYNTVDSTVNPQAITSPQRQSPPRQPPQRQPQQRQESLASLASLQRAEQQFRQAVASIGGGETPSRQPERPTRPPPSDSMSDHRQSKRRKVDADDSREGAKGFSYSHYGQVSSVPLEMEVHSCKGASAEPDRRGNSPEHILVNDGAVYRAQGGCCNIVLKHRGEIPFSLKKLIIKTPRSGCHDEMNVREGTVSISMVSDPRFLRTVASHASQSIIPSSRRSHRRNEPSQAFSGAMAPPLNARRIESPSSALRARIQRARATQHQDAQVGTEQEDKSDDESTQHDAARDQLSLSDPEPSNSRDSSPNNETSDSESSDGIAGVAEALAQNLDSRQRQLLEALGVRVPSHMHSRSSRNRPLSPTTVFARPAAETRNQETDTMTPIARFSIEHERAAVQIRFNPPVSARYILIKMWAPFNPGRMDIESIIAHGFAGPRFFPSQEPR
ncbi:uncharacterized protein GIQ15_05146 [Arthroderma uncinatum]|uniref:uncharacterized protein n=1 Tax=Arthroderma uncinatum TaxID=74035 RepID=UPI00144AD9B9|nr:uncharacterized protein GIQ15_05146 [Arthroderma uncinatum]KAF3482387.1 hypothetical protein GIQ15_05146 [Arthroderma uncinatum]